MSIDVIRLAKEAHGALITEDYPGHTGQLDPWTLRLLERFTALVMEECAKVCETVGNHNITAACAETIRARKPA